MKKLEDFVIEGVLKSVEDIMRKESFRINRIVWHAGLLKIENCSKRR